MKIGINGTGLVQKASVPAVVEHALQAEADGFESYWLAEHPVGGFDALTVLGIVGQSAKQIELGTAIIPTFPRHPLTLASQAQTTANVIPQTLSLGIGLSHATMMAELGIDFDKPIRHLREYLSILMPLLRDGRVDSQGETLSAQAKFFQPPGKQVPVLVAALGPQALGVCGRMADGTTLAWVGPKTIASHIKPRLEASANAAERPTPRIVATLPVCVTNQETKVRDTISTNLAMYGKLPSYRAMFDREGVQAPGELAIVGSAAQVRDQIETLGEAGVTDFAASEFGLNRDEFSATRELLRARVSG